MFVTMSVDIDAPPEVVWSYLVEPEKTKAWFTALKEYNWTSEPGGVGSTFHWDEEAGGRKYSIDFETTEWDPPNVFGYRQTEGDFKSYEERWVVEPTPTGSRFTFNDHIEFDGFFAPVIDIFAPMTAKKSGAQVLQNLKRLAEEEASAGQAM